MRAFKLNYQDRQIVDHAISTIIEASAPRVEPWTGMTAAEKRVKVASGTLWSVARRNWESFTHFQYLQATGQKS